MDLAKDVHIGSHKLVPADKSQLQYTTTCGTENTKPDWITDPKGPTI